MFSCQVNNDVYDWARGWVGACYANKILSGRGEGVYDPGATVTAVEAASMLMRALGYFQYANDVADGFELATVTQGTKIGIFDGVGSSATEPMTRNQVAQMVLNALQSGVVEPDGNTTTFLNPDGTVLATTGKVNYVYVTSAKDYASAIGKIGATSIGSYNQGYIVELGERLYNGDLKLNDETTDVFGRPARYWEYKGEAIGTYEKREQLKKEWTVKVTGEMLYDLLGKDVVQNYRSINVTIDGEDDERVNTNVFGRSDITRNNDKKVGATGKGVLTQVYVDTNKKDIYIAIINTYLAQAQEDYDERNDEVDLLIYKMVKSGSSRSPIYQKDTQSIADSVNADITVDGDDFNVKEVKDEDFFLVTVADGAVQSIAAPEILSDTTINSFKRTDWVTADGTKYEYGDTAKYDPEVLDIYDDANMKDITYNVILDKYGYLIGIEQNEDPDQYVFLTGLETGNSNLAAKNVDANIIHLDGTMETVKVDMTKSKNHLGNGLADDRGVNDNLSQMNTWCTYSVSDSGVYTLTQVAVATTADPTSSTVKAAQYAQDVNTHHDSGVTTKTINTKYVSLIGAYNAVTPATAYVYGNDETVYINAEQKGVYVDDTTNGNNRWIVDDVDSVTVGVKNANLIVNNLAGVKDGFKYADEEIYTLYDKDGYIIAVVTLDDEDDGASSKFVYVTSTGVNKEIDNGKSSTKAAGDGKYTWTREVIMDGKKAELTEVGDNLEHIGVHNTQGRMLQGQWYEVKFDADGNVRSSKSIETELKDADNTDGKIYKVEDVEVAVNEKDTVVLADRTTVTHLHFNDTGRRGTLYTTTDNSKGFSVDPDVKVVLIVADEVDADNNKIGDNLFDDVQDIYTGYSGLKRALENMNAVAPYAVVDSKSQVEIGAILENGRATTIIINDRAPEKDDTTPVVPPVTPTDSVLDGALITVNLTDVVATAGTVANEVRTVLRNAGYVSIDTTNVAAGGGYATAVDAAKDTIRFDVASVNLHWSIKWGTTTLAIVDDTTGTTTIAANTISGDGTGYLSTMSGTNTYHDYSTPWSVSSVTAPVVITEGYIMTVNTVTAVGIGTWTVDMSNIVTCTASTYAIKVGNPLKVQVTSPTPAASVTNDQNVILTATISSGNRTDSIEVARIDWNTASKVLPTKHEISTTGLTADITALTGSLAAVPADAPITFDSANSTLSANGITVSNVALSSKAGSAKVGDSVTVTVRIQGTASAASTITFSGGATNSGIFSPSVATAPLSRTDGQTIGVAAGIGPIDTTVTWTFTVGAGDGDLTIIVA